MATINEIIWACDNIKTEYEIHIYRDIDRYYDFKAEPAEKIRFPRSTLSVPTVFVSPVRRFRIRPDKSAVDVLVIA